MSTLDEPPQNKLLETPQDLVLLPPDIQEDSKRSRVDGEVSLLTDVEVQEAKKLKLENDVSSEMPGLLPGGSSEPSAMTDMNDGSLQLQAENPEGDGDGDGGELIPAAKEGISFFGDNDVLSGRGGGTNVHPGNRNFRDLINLHRRAYLKARKNDKPAISRAIVRAIRDANGKFLKKDEKSGLWFEIGDDAAREKTSQALRQRAPEMRKLLFDTEREEARAAAEEQMRQQRMLIGMNPNQQQQLQQQQQQHDPNCMPPMPPLGGPGMAQCMPPGIQPGGGPGGMFPNPALFAMSNNGGKNNGAMPPNNMPPGQEGFAQMQMAALLGGGMNRYASNGA
jgi:hypothetical protein